MLLLVRRGHGHPAGRIVEAAHVLHRSKQIDAAVGPAIGLHALEDHLGVVERNRGRVQREGRERLDFGVMPAAIGRVALREHAIGEDDAKAEIGCGWRAQAGRFNGYNLDIHQQLLVWCGNGRAPVRGVSRGCLAGTGAADPTRRPSWDCTPIMAG